MNAQHARTGDRRARRGTIAVAMVIALVVVSLMVMVMVMTGARSQHTTVLGVQGSRTQYAAEAATSMAIKEVIDNVDRDGDGVIGTISNDGNTATDPTLAGTRLWATKAGSTVTARGQNADAARAAQFTVTASLGGGATVLLIVNNSGSLVAQETAKRTLMQGWGYTVTLLSATATQAAYDAACLNASCAYISETTLSTDVATKLTNATIPVVNDEQALTDKFGFSSTNGTFNSTQIHISNNTHYITSLFTTGNRTITTSSQPLHNITGTLGGYTLLANQVSTSTAVFAVFQRGDTLTPSGTAAGKRVHLPWGSTGFDVNTLNADGKTIMQRSIEWALLPVCHWKIDDGSGSTVVDSVSARNGTVSGASWTTGKLNGGLSFDGTDDYVTIADDAAFKVTTALTAAGWVKATAWSVGNDTSIILRKGDANPNNWELCISDGRVELLLDQSDDAGIQGNTTLPTGTWVHVAATWDGATVRIYVNGVLDNTPAARAAPIGTDTRPVYIGGRTGATDVTQGVVDDVRFYNRALTAGEIAELAAPGADVSGWKMVAP